MYLDTAALDSWAALLWMMAFKAFFQAQSQLIVPLGSDQMKEEV
jgi:hypothetical protein